VLLTIQRDGCNTHRVTGDGTRVLAVAAGFVFDSLWPIRAYRPYTMRSDEMRVFSNAQTRVSDCAML
jgi:hypothetical protein